jgi:hypothetical protein
MAKHYFQLAALLAATTPLIDNKSVNLPSVAADNGALGIVLNLVWMISAALSVMFVVIGGFKYTIANGDASQVASAKNTILYAIIGLLISLFAFAIVNFVLGKA